MRSISGFGSRILAFVFTVCFFTISVASATDVSFSYDANGNMINGDGLSYVYDDANHLTEVRLASNNSLVAQYLYDDAGTRIKKVVNGVATYYIGNYLESRVVGTQQNDTSYYFANNERVARKDPDGLKYYYHGDHLGSTSIVTNASGAVVESVAYLPYGETQSKTGSGSTYLYTDQELDSESGLYYYGARYYSPEMMRFVEPDPIIQDMYNPQNLNKYSYVLNNPLKYTDPTGKWHWGGVITGVGMTLGGLGLAAAGGPVGVVIGIDLIGLGVATAGASMVIDEKNEKWDKGITIMEGAGYVAPVFAAAGTLVAGGDKEDAMKYYEGTTAVCDAVTMIYSPKEGIKRGPKGWDDITSSGITIGNWLEEIDNDQPTTQSTTKSPFDPNNLKKPGATPEFPFGVGVDQGSYTMSQTFHPWDSTPLKGWDKK